MAERALQGSLGRLIALAENYPDPADKNFLKLQEQLAEIEDQPRWRDAITMAPCDLNIAIQSFPNSSYRVR